jgi:hypothetical protein
MNMNNGNYTITKLDTKHVLTVAITDAADTSMHNYDEAGQVIGSRTISRQGAIDGITKMQASGLFEIVVTPLVDITGKAI